MKTQPFQWTASDICDAVNGQHLFGESPHPFLNISIDSRQVDKHSLFVAIPGDRFDTHQFISSMIHKPIHGIVIQHDKVSEEQINLWKSKNLLCIAVPNTIKALGDLAHYQRMKWGGSVVGITGTNGKTSVKELTASVLTTTFNTIKTQGNFNNHIGVPKTLFQIQWQHEWAVVEMGMNHLGEIAYLAKISKPNVGIVTNIGPGHLEGVQSIDGVTQAKRELIQNLDKNGMAILNADDPRVMGFKENCVCSVITYGLSSQADISARDISETACGSNFLLTTPQNSIAIQFPGPGQFMISNALAASAIGYALTIPLTEIKTALESYEPIQGRTMIQHIDNIHIIDDTYNANPASMKAAIDSLKALCKGYNSYFICGDMYELGTHSSQYHKEIGAYAAASGVNKIFATGSFSTDVCDGAIEAGMHQNDLFCGSLDEITRQVISMVDSGDWLLVKGSRAMKMEHIIEQIKGN